ncbi:MAG: signal recognition particle-docking protein FtsY [Chloroflexi bacterium]|nr:signal recognition particle-docking protein FtsY [Chloroflexota bacterium]
MANGQWGLLAEWSTVWAKRPFDHSTTRPTGIIPRVLDSLKNFTAGLTRTRQAVFGRIASIVGASEITDDTWDELEATLIQADMGVAVAGELIARLKKHVRDEGVTQEHDLRAFLRQELIAQLKAAPLPRLLGDPAVLLMVGVNGSGKTTTTAKLAKLLHDRDGVTPILAATDTFRAAAIDQLKEWGHRLNVEVIAGQPNGDPGAVVYDAIAAARARRADLVIVDTAGRLHTKFNLMEELKKVRGVAAKASAGAPHAVLLVLDSTTGQNGLAQAKAFTEAVGVTGLVLTKLDGSAKGGVAFAIHRDLGLPIVYAGLGEKLDDLVPFDPEAFVDGLLE